MAEKKYFFKFRNTVSWWEVLANRGLSRAGRPLYEQVCWGLSIIGGGVSIIAV